ncbi:MAG: hypothetical protein KDA71_21770 [Planctomycetales bacterium]|nr:hypothetical protein [Planctomycetales bacterium]
MPTRLNDGTARLNNGSARLNDGREVSCCCALLRRDGLEEVANWLAGNIHLLRHDHGASGDDRCRCDDWRGAHGRISRDG